MDIIGHRLHADAVRSYPFVASPNRGGPLRHRYVVIHYTALPDAATAIRRLSDPSASVSAHLVIARNGDITQLVPFDEIAFHAGESCWEGERNLNRCSIGIELDNAGRLDPVGSGWKAWFGHEYSGTDVLETVHKNDTQLFGWHTYTPEQLDRSLEVARLLAARLGVIDVLGHDEISPGRKWDPGPAFPMERFRTQVFGRVP